LAYHWDIGGIVHTLITTTRHARIASISPICPAANWIEREIHDYFGVRFDDHGDLSPLVLRSGDDPGLFHWNGQKGGDR
jgi:NADH:ubiquinone oxidoreductase subunit C